MRRHGDHRDGGVGSAGLGDERAEHAPTTELGLRAADREDRPGGDWLRHADRIRTFSARRWSTLRGCGIARWGAMVAALGMLTIDVTAVRVALPAIQVELVRPTSNRPG